MAFGGRGTAQNTVSLPELGWTLSRSNPLFQVKLVATDSKYTEPGLRHRADGSRGDPCGGLCGVRGIVVAGDLHLVLEVANDDLVGCKLPFDLELIGVDGLVAPAGHRPAPE